MDDTNVLLDPADVNWFLKRMSTLGKPVGIIIGKEKTKILTNTNGVSIIPFLSASVGASLSEAIKTFTVGEATRGLRVLDIPLGSIPFQREYITKFSKNLTTNTTNMRQLTADILSTVDPDNLPDNNLEWASPLTAAVRATTRNIIGHATNLEAIPEYAMEIDCMPESLHSLGFLCPDRTAVMSFLLPLFRTIRYATQGVPLQHTTVPLGTYFQDQFQDWRTSEPPPL
eukprot:scaffold9128_cov52-Attheya_sp.AAC.3